nr:single-stranded DNA-binding protein [Actinomyces sp.]
MNHLTITGYLGADPELCYVAATGKQVVSVRVADTPRSLNRETGQWENGTTLWLRASAWGPLAEHIANSVRKGDRVTLTGRLTQHDYVNRNGEQRHRIELSIEDFAVSLARTSVSVHREPRRGGAHGSVASDGSVTGNSGMAGNSADGGVTGGWPGDVDEDGPWGPVAVPGGGA